MFILNQISHILTQCSSCPLPEHRELKSSCRNAKHLNQFNVDIKDHTQKESSFNTSDDQVSPLLPAAAETANPHTPAPHTPTVECSSSKLVGNLATAPVELPFQLQIPWAKNPPEHLCKFRQRTILIRLPFANRGKVHKTFWKHFRFKRLQAAA